MHRTISRIAFTVVGLSLGTAAWSPAAEVSWITPGGGTFQVAGNWSGGVVPGPNDTAIFNLNASTYTISSTQNTGTISNQKLVLANDRIMSTMVEPNGPWELTAAVGDSVVVGDKAGDQGLLYLFPGHLISRNAVIGNEAGSIGTVMISGGVGIPAGQWNVIGTLDVGRGGAGTLTFARPTMTADVVNIGVLPGSSGTVSGDGTFGNVNVGGSSAGAGGTGAFRESLFGDMSPGP